MSYKIAIVGNKDSVAGFKALGVDVVPAIEKQQAQNDIQNIYESSDYAVVFITEDWVDQLQDFLSELPPKALPAIVAVPSQKGSTGAGEKGIRKMVEQAVGSDIFKE